MTTGNSTDALAAAGITSDRRGGERLRDLTDGERQFYRIILRSFGVAAPLGPDALANAASELDLGVESTLERLARADLVHHDPATGAILVAYPFSGRPTAHRVRIGASKVYAMCAIDALGIAPMLGEPIEIDSHDPLTGEGIRIALEPGGQGEWQPKEAVVVSGTAGRGESCDCCCPVVNFFASTANAEHWLAARPDIHATLISIPEAIVAGRAVFGDLLKEA